MRYYIVDAFAEKIFEGNPAGVCVLEEALSDEKMQLIAFENNLAETAFVRKEGATYSLRWFTPDVEIDLCGHGTLAAAYVMLTIEKKEKEKITFETMSGQLIVRKEGDLLVMDFPNRRPVKCEMPEGLEEALGCKILETAQSRDLLVRIENEQAVREMIPDIEKLTKISAEIDFGIIVTAQGENCDFVSRYFAPNATIIEDPVTGSAHSTLIPYWYDLLGKKKMMARQLSKRGGALYCHYDGDYVQIGGEAQCYLRGELEV